MVTNADIAIGYCLIGAALVSWRLWSGCKAECNRREQALRYKVEQQQESESAVIRKFTNPNAAVVEKCPQPVSSGGGRIYSRDEYDYIGYLIEKAEQQEKVTKVGVKAIKPVVKVPEWFIDKWVAQLTISPAEQLIINELEKYDIKWEREVSFAAMPLTDKGANYRYDFLLPDHGIVLEYDSALWHADTQRLTVDAIKNQFCADNGIEVIRYNSKHYYNMAYHIKELMIKLGVRKSVATC